MAGRVMDDGWPDADPYEPLRETGPTEPAWPYPLHPNQYGVEGTLGRVDAFAAGARRLTGVRGVAARVVVGLLLAGLLASVVAAAAQGIHLLG